LILFIFVLLIGGTGLPVRAGHNNRRALRRMFDPAASGITLICLRCPLVRRFAVWPVWPDRFFSVSFPWSVARIPFPAFWLPRRWRQWLQLLHHSLSVLR